MRVSSAIDNSLTIISGPSLCSYHSHMCKEPGMITFNSDLINSWLESGTVITVVNGNYNICTNPQQTYFFNRSRMCS
jgi:hypothetical protein